MGSLSLFAWNRLSVGQVSNRQLTILNLLQDALHQLLLAYNGLVAAHLAAVSPASSLAPSLRRFAKEKFLVSLTISLKLPDETIVSGQDVLIAILPCEPLVCGFILAEVAALDPQVVGGGDHESEADDHVEVADEVVPGEVVAAHAERGIHAVVNLTCCHLDCRHRDPSNEEHIEPDVEDKHEVVAGILSADTSVGPEGVGLVPVDAFVADVAVKTPGRFYHFALETEVLRWHLLHHVHPVEFWVLRHVTGLLPSHKAECDCELGHAHRCRKHEVPNVQHRLDHEDVVEPNEHKQEQEQELVAVVSLDGHEGQLSDGTPGVPGLRKHRSKGLVVFGRGKACFCHLCWGHAGLVLGFAVSTLDCEIFADPKIGYQDSVVQGSHAFIVGRIDCSTE